MDKIQSNINNVIVKICEYLYAHSQNNVFIHFTLYPDLLGMLNDAFKLDIDTLLLLQNIVQSYLICQKYALYCGEYCIHKLPTHKIFCKNCGNYIVIWLVNGKDNGKDYQCTNCNSSECEFLSQMFLIYQLENEFEVEENFGIILQQIMM